MSDSNKKTATFQIPTPYGNLFAQQWLPENSSWSDRTSILLLHDSLGSVQLWRDFPQRLADASGRRVIAYDRLGFGQSEPVSQPIGLDFIAQEAERFIPRVCDFFQINRFIVFGHSVGGGMAVHAAAQYPERCELLMTESAQAFVETLTRSGIREAETLFKDAASFDRLARYHGERTRWVLDSWIHTWLSPEFDNWSLAETLPDVQCPTLVLHGEADEYGSAAQPQMIAEGTAGSARLELLPNLHHVPHREDPDGILKQVTDFIDAHLS